MINLEILNQPLSELKKIGKNKIKNYDVFEKLRILHKEVKIAVLQLEELRAKHNVISAEIGLLIKKKAGLDEVGKLKIIVKENKATIIGLELKIRDINSELLNDALYIPNFPEASVPFGNDDDDNVEIFNNGLECRSAGLDHVELATKLNLVDWERTSVGSGARFVSYINNGARLKRAITNLMLDHNVSQGYTEMSTPLLVNTDALIGTGQLPKFKDDLYITDSNQLYLIPTSEVSLTNFYRGNIFTEDALPIKLTQYSPCFRKEAGAAGKDNRGIIRLHQFDKVELVQLVNPTSSKDVLNDMVSTATGILDKLELPYRTVMLCSGVLGFSSKNTYDIEVWMPSQNKYREVSSCSNCGDFQARRINLKYKSEGKNAYVHTLNGSSLAIDRLIAAFLENHQTERGSIKIPKNLQKYLGKQEIE